MSSNPTQPLVSIGLPVYHRPELLRRTLESLTQQTYRNLEIVVSDDCSPGTATRDVIEEFARTDPRIRYIRQPRNIGVVLNHRFVFERATGEYFFWCPKTTNGASDTARRAFARSSTIRPVMPGAAQSGTRTRSVA